MLWIDSLHMPRDQHHLEAVSAGRNRNGLLIKRHLDWMVDCKVGVISGCCYCSCLLQLLYVTCKATEATPLAG
jgi:hypothetical protein